MSAAMMMFAASLAALSGLGIFIVGDEWGIWPRSSSSDSETIK